MNPELKSLREQVVLTTDFDVQIGTSEKLEAHLKGLKHRAISVFIFDNEKNLVLQRRAAGKYHSPLRWSNTCCGHPRPGESTEDAAGRRLVEEMGISCDLSHVGTYSYELDVGTGLTENEFVHLFVGHYDGSPNLNPDEASEWRSASLPTIEKEIVLQPEEFTTWFPVLLTAVIESYPNLP